MKKHKNGTHEETQEWYSVKTLMLGLTRLTCTKPHYGNYAQKEVIIKFYNYFM